VNHAWDFHKIPCNNFVWIKTEGDVKHYQCLGHHQAFHGDATREHKFWIYDRHDKVENFLRWDFVDDPKFICSHHHHEGGKEYRCLGHSHGDKLVPTFHGDNSKEHNFWVYPSDRELGNPAWDFRTEEICNNHEFVGDSDGLKHYRCHGHSTTYHGQPTHDHSFWIYGPHHHNVPNEGKWDYRAGHAGEVCSHHEHVGDNHYHCLGHSNLGDSV